MPKSFDEIVGTKNTLLDSVVNGMVKEHIADKGVTSDEIKEIAPIIKPSQAENIFESAKDFVDIKEIRDLLPFVKRETIDDIARKLIAENKSIDEIVMFVSSDVVDELAISSYEIKGMSAIGGIIPFMGRDALKQIVEKEFAKNGLRNVKAVFHFLDGEYLNQLAKQIIEKDGIVR